MKTLMCDLCNHKASGDTFESWMNALKPHYMEKHSDFMKTQASKTEKDRQKEMITWMDENRKRFEAA